MALGAQRGDILRLVARQLFVLVVLGAASGIFSAIVISRVMQSLLFDVSSGDLVTIAATLLFMCLIGLMAAYVPALRALSITPVTALRQD